MPSCSRREMIVSNVLALERLLLRQIKTLVVKVSHCDKVLNISNPKWGRIPAIKRCCKHAPSPVASIPLLSPAYPHCLELEGRLLGEKDTSRLGLVWLDVSVLRAS